MNPIVNLLTNQLHIQRTNAVLLLFGLITTGIVILFVVVIPNTIQEAGNFQEKAPEYVAFFQETYDNFINNFQKKHSSLYNYIEDKKLLDNLTSSAQSVALSMANDLPNLLSGLLNVASMFIFIPLITFFYLLDGVAVKRKIYSLIPNKYFELYINLSFRINSQLSNYITGQLTDAFIIGTLSVVGLGFLGVDFFFAIGIFAGIANLVLYVGPAAGAIPAIILTVMEYKAFDGHILNIIILFAIIQLIDNIFVQPLVIGKSVNLHPLVVMIAVLIGGKVGGLLGMLLAIPVTTVSKVFIQELFAEFQFWRSYKAKTG
jgi:putative permease